MVNIFRGYVKTINKKCIQKFGNGEPLLTLSEASALTEFAGILNGKYTVIDIDEGQKAEKLLRLVTDLGLNVRIYKTTRGYHFVFLNSEYIKKNLTKQINALGIPFDSRYGKNSYIIVKYNGVDREMVQDFDDTRPIDTVPKWLMAIKNGKEFCGMTDGSGRNNALFSHILTLQKNGFSEDEVRQVIRYINDYVFDEPLAEDELEKILRDEAFKLGNSYMPDGSIPSYIYYDTAAKRFKVNCPLLANHIRKNLRYIFVRDSVKGGVLRYVYENGCYRLYSDEMLKGVIKEYVSKFDVNLLRMSDVHEVFQQITTDLVFVGNDALNTNEDLINFQNCVLRLSDMAALPHSADILSTIQIPCHWTGESRETPVFDSFMASLTNGNKQIEALLLEFMGVCLSNVKGWRMKKALFMVGPGDTGKSQLKSLTELLLGRGNYIGIDLKEIEARFGTGNIYNKRLAGSSDMSFLTVDELKTFKKCTGGDSLFAEFKGQNGFEFTYNGLLWFCMNRLPKFGGDDGKWVYDRIMQVECNNVIPPEKQDKFLLDKLYAERDGIVYKAIMALRTVIANGYIFSEPASIKASRAEYMAENNTVLSFFKECMEVRPDGRIRDNCTTGRVYDVYKAWCNDNNHGYAKTAKEFRTELAAHLNTTFADMTTRRGNGTFYHRYTLTAEAKENYRRAYGYDDSFPLASNQ